MSTPKSKVVAGECMVADSTSTATTTTATTNTRVDAMHDRLVALEELLAAGDGDIVAELTAVKAALDLSATQLSATTTRVAASEDEMADVKELLGATADTLAQTADALQAALAQNEIMAEQILGLQDRLSGACPLPPAKWFVRGLHM
jgi:uncharacterized protein involved in exopolysaccharide biosynthesis